MGCEAPHGVVVVALFVVFAVDFFPEVLDPKAAEHVGCGEAHLVGTLCSASARAHNEAQRILWACLSGLGAAWALLLGHGARVDVQPLWEGVFLEQTPSEEVCTKCCFQLTVFVLRVLLDDIVAVGDVQGLSLEGFLFLFT